MLDLFLQNEMCWIVDRVHQGCGLGRALVRDGARGIPVHAISAEAKAFYLRLGFDPSPIESMTLMVTLSDLRKSIR
jgi:hypothetical protein